MTDGRAASGGDERIGPTWGSRLVGIEGLRALAATSVLVHHTVTHAPVQPNLGSIGRWAVPNLASGLTLFFTLSGFLLYRPFAAAVMRNEQLPSTWPSTRSSLPAGIRGADASASHSCPPRCC
jgi:peptidoglycan/LPS O-acetylase OafA/YrhL